MTMEEDMGTLTSRITGPTPDSAATPSARCISPENKEEFREKFDRLPFAVSHSLRPDHPLFQTERLKKLARDLQAQGCHIHYDAGDIKIGQRWDAVPAKTRSFEQTFDEIANAGAWIFIRQVEKDPEYSVLLDQCIDDISELSGRNIRRECKFLEGIVFLTSPNRITSYHIDRECTILLQVSGDKEISIFEREDREVLPEKEIETFWSADNNAAQYREQFQNRAHVFQMKTGTGVHIPINCPHWLKNGNNVSISMNINYQLKDTRRKYIYQSNYYLRKMGMNPVPPGRSPVRDLAKNLTMGTLVNVKDLVRNGFKRKPAGPTPY
jgi:hypothetical protein